MEKNININKGIALYVPFTIKGVLFKIKEICFIVKHAYYCNLSCSFIKYAFDADSVFLCLSVEVQGTVLPVKHDLNTSRNGH